MECPEFRALLLLLRSNLKESMIPHRMKLRELVINSWKHYFQALKCELAIGPRHICSFGALSDAILSFLGSGGASFFYYGYMVGPK
jgi:hypothetical protein